MSNPVWPGTLPQAPLPGWADTPQPQAEAFKVDVGPAKLRQRTTMARTQRTLPIEITGAQLATLRTFFETTCLGGSLEWDWTNGDPITGATVSYRWLKPPPATSITPSKTTANRMYAVTLSVETV